MRIALLSHEYPAETGFGGIGTYTWHHARALVRLGHEVEVFAGSTSPSMLRPDNHDGVTVWRSRSDGIMAPLHRVLGRLEWWWTRERVRNAFDMSIAFRRRNAVRSFDVVEMPECGAEGFFINGRVRATTVVRLHSPSRLIMPFYDVRGGDRWACALLESRAIRNATALSSTSYFLAEQARASLGITRPIPVVHNGIDLDWFDAEVELDVRSQYRIPKDRPLVLFAGRLEGRKGMDVLPAVTGAILARHDVSFAFAGDDLFGHLRDDVLAPLTTAQLRGSAHPLGRIPAAHVRDAMRLADVVFLPSLWESCPYACLEAMAAGRAIVASDAGGFPELLTDRENGLVVKAGDAAGFVAAIDELLGDASLRARLGQAARATVERSFRAVDTARRLVQLYGDVSR